jgi:CBS domain-containing protein
MFQDVGMKTVALLLQKKGNQVFSVSQDETILHALEVMNDKNIGAVLVLDHGEVVGIFSERDYARKVDLLGRKAEDTPVTEVMTSQVICVRPDQSIAECMALMTNRRIRHLPVLGDHGLVGLISIGDVIKEVIDEQEFIIEQLESYISLPR